MSLAVAAVIVVPLAAVGTSVIRRHVQLNQLGSADLAERERALNALIKEAHDDPRWLVGAARRLKWLPEDAILSLVNAVQIAAPPDSGFFYVALSEELSRLTDPAFMSVALGLRTVEYADHDAVVNEALTHLRSAPNRDARQPWITLLDQFQAWTTPPVPVEIYVEWLARGVDAERPALRLHTARQLGDLPIRQPQFDVGLTTAPLRELLRDDNVGVRRAALWAVAGYVRRDPTLLADIQARMTEDSDPKIRQQAARLVRVWSQTKTTDQTALKGSLTIVPSPNESDWSHHLAVLDAQPMASLDIPLNNTMPHHVRVAATRASTLAEPTWLLHTLRANDRPGLRDVAVVILADRFTADQLDPFARKLLDDHDPDARLSGAVLAGLIGRASDAIDQAARRERRESSRIAMQVARWMQGDRPELDEQVQALLGSAHLPESTLLLAMLHVGQRRAVFDRLLGLGENQPLRQTAPPRRTVELLRTERWSLVLNQYLPTTAPRLPAHGSDQAFLDQLADLRAWHTLHRFDWWE